MKRFSARRRVKVSGWLARIVLLGIANTAIATA